MAACGGGVGGRRRRNRTLTATRRASACRRCAGFADLPGHRVFGRTLLLATRIGGHTHCAVCAGGGVSAVGRRLWLAAWGGQRPGRACSLSTPPPLAPCSRPCSLHSVTTTSLSTRHTHHSMWSYLFGDQPAPAAAKTPPPAADADEPSCRRPSLTDDADASAHDAGPGTPPSTDATPTSPRSARGASGASVDEEGLGSNDDDGASASPPSPPTPTPQTRARRHPGGSCREAGVGG